MVAVRFFPNMSDLTSKQDTAVLALLECATMRDAARTAGVTERTIARWLQDPVFVAAYRAARRDLVETGIARIQQAIGAAVETLTRNLKCGKASVEVQAARVILDAAVKGVELIDLAERIDQLELAMRRRQR